MQLVFLQGTVATLGDIGKNFPSMTWYNESGNVQRLHKVYYDFLVPT